MSVNDIFRNEQNKNILYTILYSWPIIIIMFFLFFPIAFFLLYKRFTYDKKLAFQNSGKLKKLGWGFLIFGCFGFFISISNLMDGTAPMTDLPVYIMMIAIFWGPGAYFLIKAKKMRQYGECYRSYMNLIVNHRETSIANIAATTGRNYEIVNADLNEMVKDGVFGDDAYVDERNREFILYASGPRAANEPLGQERPQTQTREVNCTNCGANNVVGVGQVKECEYCGSSITA